MPTFYIFHSDILYFAFQPKVIGPRGPVGQTAVAQFVIHMVLLQGTEHVPIRYQNVEVQLALAPTIKSNHATQEIVLVSSILVPPGDDLI